jgi:hypothetical protein
MKYKVLITTAGGSSRLGDLTKFTNKSLIKVGRKPAISYVIEQYPITTTFVIVLGHYADQIKDFLKLAYPKRKFTFVRVKQYEKKNLRLKLVISASRYLQCPFVYHSWNRIVTNRIPPPGINWIEQNIKRQPGPFGIKDYKKFWFIAKKLVRNKSNNKLSDVIDLMEKEGSSFAVKRFTGFNIKERKGLTKARREVKDSFPILDKADESIYLFDKFVIKFFFNKRMVKNRVKRARVLSKLSPKVTDVIGNFYKYDYVKGTLMADGYNPSEFRDFLTWANTNLWKPAKTISDNKFKSICKEFYYDKTVERISRTLKKLSIKDKSEVINGIEIPSLKKIFSMIDWNYLSSAKQTGFHGDFILDNILKTKKGYCLLDWRQDFGGLIKSGDMYYDLAKLNHNLTVSHDLVNKQLFTVEVRKGKIICDILRKNYLVEGEKVFWKFVDENKLDPKKIKLLTPIIWLNMSPLHEDPLDLFLFYFGKYNLWRAINEQN